MHHLPIIPACRRRVFPQVNRSKLPRSCRRGHVAETGLTIVVCEDDPVTRATIASLAQEHHHRVIAETDNPVDAVALVERFGADIVILDLALATGSGEELLDEVRADRARCSVISFSAYCHDLSPEPPVVAVVEKPDFERLAAVLSNLSALTGGARDRRAWQPRRTVRTRLAETVSDTAPEFYGTLNDAQRGDALLVLHPAEPAAIGDLAAALRETLRVQDWMLVETRRIAVLLVGGNPVAPDAVIGRFPPDLDGCPVAATILTGDEQPSDVLLRLRTSLAPSS